MRSLSCVLSRLCYATFLRERALKAFLPSRQAVKQLMKEDYDHDMVLLKITFTKVEKR